MAETETLPAPVEPPPATPKPPATPAAPAEALGPAPKRKSLVSIADDFRKQLDDMQAAITEKMRPTEEAYQAAAKEKERVFETRVKPAGEELEASLRAPLPAAPKATPRPQAPDISPRAFLTAESKQALPTLVSALGLLTTGVMGIFGRAPTVALHGLAGAMTGWAEGDHIRAERLWKQYLGDVDRIRGDNDQAWKEWDAAMQLSGSNTTRATAIYTARMAELKQPEMAMAAAQHGMQTMHDTLSLATQTVNTIETHSMRVEQARFNQQMRLAMEARKREEDEAMVAAYAAPGVLDTLGQQWFASGQMPPGLTRSAAGRKMIPEIIKAGNQWARDHGIDPTTAPAVRAEMGAARRALGQVESQLATAKGQGAVVEKHLTTLVELGDQMHRSGSPLVNRYQLYMRGEVEGDADVAKYQMQAYEVGQEVAKLFVGTAQGDAESRADARRVVRGELNQEQLKAVADGLKVNLRKRVQAWEEDRESYVQRINALTGGTPGPGQTGGGTMRIRRIGDTSGKFAEGPVGPVPPGWEKMP